MVMNFEDYIWLNYKHRPNELELANTPGYWRVIGGCPGGDDCKHAMRIAGMRCNGDMPLTVSYAEYGVRDENGRFVSPYREWYRQRSMEVTHDDD